MSDNVTKKILIVDDESNMRSFLSNLLRSEGFHPIEADTRALGLQKAKKENPAVIIIDMMMLGEAGIQMYHSLKHHPALQKIPVIMLSAIDKETFFRYHKVQNIQPGHGVPLPEAYLGKPPETEELIKIVTNLSKTGNAK